MTEIKYNDHMPVSIHSLDRKLEIRVLGHEEPNNGRMLWKVDVIFNNQNINDKIFDGNWNYINENIEQLELTDNRNRYYYIPVESAARLIDSHTLKIEKLQYSAISTTRFLGSKFHNNEVLEIFNDEILRYDIETKVTRRCRKKIDGSILKINAFIDGNLKIIYCNSINNKRVEFEIQIKNEEFEEMVPKDIL